MKSCDTKNLIQRCSYLRIGHSAIHREKRAVKGRLEEQKKRINIMDRRQGAVGKVTDDSQVEGGWEVM